MRTWVMASQKGGVGKSALATQLAVAAQEAGEKVAIIDIDPQASSVAWSRVRGSSTPEVHAALPSDIEAMVGAGRQLKYTLLIIDTPPHTRSDTVTAVRFADLIICPTKPELFEIEALKDTVSVLELTGKRSLALGVVNSLRPVQEKALAAEYEHAATAVRAMRLRVCSQFICNRKDISDAISSGKGVTETAPRSVAASEVRNLYRELSLLEVPNNVISLKDSA